MAVLPGPEHDALSRWDKDSQILIWKFSSDEYQLLAWGLELAMCLIRRRFLVVTWTLPAK